MESASTRSSYDNVHSHPEPAPGPGLSEQKVSERAALTWALGAPHHRTGLDAHRHDRKNMPARCHPLFQCRWDDIGSKAGRDDDLPGRTRSHCDQTYNSATLSDYDIEHMMYLQRCPHAGYHSYDSLDSPGR